MRPLSRRTVHALFAALLSLAAPACDGHPLDGTWHQADATTKLPDAVGGGDLHVDATLVLDDMASPKTFELDLKLEFAGLNDTVDARGTYVAEGSDLTMTFTGFVIDPGSGNMASVAEDGSQCLTLQGFGGAAVCFPSPQTTAYLVGDTLALTIHQAIAGAPVSETKLTLAKSP